MIQNLVANNGNHLKRLARGNGVHDHVAMDADEVFRVQDAVLILARGVDDFGRELLALVLDGPVEGVFDRGIVALDEGTFDEADGQGRLAWRGKGTD